MARMKKDKLLQVVEKVDENGNLIARESCIKLAPEPDFVKLYLRCYCSIKGLSATLNPLLLEFLNYMSYAGEGEYGGQLIVINKALKEIIAKNTGVTIKRVDQAITQLVKYGVFDRKGRGLYQVNPDLIGKGHWTDIHNIKNIRAQIDFKERTIETTIEMDDTDSQISFF